MKHSKSFIAIILVLITAVICPVKANAQVVTTSDGLKFDADYYKMCNPEVVATYGDSFEGLYSHYLEHGKEEGRLPYAGYVRNSLGNQYSNSGTDLECTVINNSASRVYVGDSRAYIMHEAIGDDGASWIAFPGSRYDTFAKRAASYVDGMPLAGKQIVIMYGINDIMAYGAQPTFCYYNSFLNGKAQEWINLGAKVYFVSLVGINKDLVTNGKKVKAKEVKFVNDQTSIFNGLMAAMPANVNKIYINAGPNPFYDGIHYNPVTCRLIYNQINGQL